MIGARSSKRLLKSVAKELNPNQKESLTKRFRHILVEYGRVSLCSVSPDSV
jgi:hypothetical protein